MAPLRTEVRFTLPKGYVDASGAEHRSGTMRLATGRDELEPLRDPRIQGPDDPYLTILVLARVVTELGTVPEITPEVVEGMFAADLEFLQELYGAVNFGTDEEVAELLSGAAPQLVALEHDEDVG
jgi:hypothetical protein